MYAIRNIKMGKWLCGLKPNSLRKCPIVSSEKMLTYDNFWSALSTFQNFGLSADFEIVKVSVKVEQTYGDGGVYYDGKRYKP